MKYFSLSSPFSLFSSLLIHSFIHSPIYPFIYADKVTEHRGGEASLFSQVYRAGAPLGQSLGHIILVPAENVH